MKYVPDLLLLYFATGLITAATRPRMIWQEEDRQYRLFLVMATALAGIAFNVLAAIYVGLKNWYQFSVATIDGQDPSEVKE